MEKRMNCDPVRTGHRKKDARELTREKEESIKKVTRLVEKMKKEIEKI